MMHTQALLPHKLAFRAISLFNRIPLLLAIFTSLGVASPCSGETLRDLLLSYKIPTASYTEKKLLASVQGAGLVAGSRAVIIYSELDIDNFVGPLQALEYDFALKAIRSKPHNLPKDDVCNGSPLGVYLIDGYTLFSTHISPSAECLLLLDERLVIRNQFYGFSPVRIAPSHVAITEDMVHFAPVHPERMEVIALSTGAKVEIYPPAHDPLRMQLALRHKKVMPSPEICMRMNDPCDPGLFDEDFYPVSTDGHGRLAFVASQSASHILTENSEPQTVAEQSVFYSYAFEKDHWLYCEEQVEDAAVATLQSALKDHFEVEVLNHCKPDLKVSPDTSTAAFNPFGNR